MTWRGVGILPVLDDREMAFDRSTKQLPLARLLGRKLHQPKGFYSLDARTIYSPPVCSILSPSGPLGAAKPCRLWDSGMFNGNPPGPDSEVKSNAKEELI